MVPLARRGSWESSPLLKDPPQPEDFDEHKTFRDHLSYDYVGHPYGNRCSILNHRNMSSERGEHTVADAYPTPM